ncbi:uncharacterized protein [Littorina saxatilis]|uniref:Uncharacterized protein n=1 Tax=Littorina saxatilis TaxID=31220 RepID=A0AAN9GA02_9CAEN
MPLFGYPVANGMAHPVMAPEVPRAKRKIWEEQECNMDMVEMEDGDCPAKRHCKEIFPDPAGDNGIVVQHGQVHQFVFPHTPPSPLWQAKLPPQMQDDLHGCMKDIAGATYPVPLSLPQRPVTPPRQIMQPPVMTVSPMMLDGETYNRMSEVDLNLCISSMDSDCCPDPSQYQHSLEFCSTPCSGGVRSPVSNDIRCSCRAWDKKDVVPYHSDYY